MNPTGKKKYSTTKKECLEEIARFDNVCDRCGRKLVPMKTVDNADNPTYWVGCYHGSKEYGHFTHGVPKETYKLAVKLVLEDGLYLNMDKEFNGNFEYLFQNGVSKVAGIIRSIEYMKIGKPRYTKKQLQENYEKYYNKTE